MKPTMYYDGGCPLCRREVAHYRRVDRARRVEWLDIGADAAPLQALQVSREAALRRLHVRDARGALHTGVAAFAVIWSELPGYRWLARLVRLPGMMAVLEPAYRLFAARRFARRCAEGACRLP